MHINRLKHTLLQIEPCCHVVSTKWHRKLISECVQDCLVADLHHLQPAAEQGTRVPRKNESLEAPGSVLEKRQWVCRKLCLTTAHGLEPAENRRGSQCTSVCGTSHDVWKRFWHSTDVPWHPAQESTAHPFKTHDSCPSTHWTSCRLQVRISEKGRVATRNKFTDYRVSFKKPGPLPQVHSQNLYSVGEATWVILRSWDLLVIEWYRCLPSGFSGVYRYSIRFCQIAPNWLNTICLPPCSIISVFSFKVKQPTLKMKRFVFPPTFLECGPGHNKPRCFVFATSMERP